MFSPDTTQPVRFPQRTSPNYLFFKPLRRQLKKVVKCILLGFGILYAARRNDYTSFIQAVNDAYNTLTINKDRECRSKLYYALAEALDFVREDSYVVILHVTFFAYSIEIVEQKLFLAHCILCIQFFYKLAFF